MHTMQSPVSLMRLLGLGTALAVVPLSVHAQDNFDNDWNHFSLNLRAEFNIGAKFTEPGLNGGFVRQDSSGSDSQTWNWGYNSPSTVTSSEGSQTLHLVNSAQGSENATENGNVGYDFNFIRDIGHESWGQWGIKFGLGYTPIDFRDQSAISSSATSTEYNMGEVIAPNPPYVGTKTGPGPIISLQPEGPSTTTSASIVGNHNLDASLFDLRLGPAINVPIAKRFSVQGSGGLAVGVVDSHFTFADSGLHVSGGDTRTSALPGVYGEVGFAYRIARPASIYTGAQFEYLGDFHQSAAGRTATLQLGATIFYELGIQFHF
jgi:hypothetical protein